MHYYSNSIIIFFLFIVLVASASARTVIDALDRKVTVPDRVERVICSGPGCLRLLTFLQAEELVVAVDDIESKRNTFDARPYALAISRYQTLPIFGQFRGHDNPELILSLSPGPQVIFKTYSTMGHDPVELQQKTGIPVVVLNYGNLSSLRNQFYQTLQLMGIVLGREQRAEELIDFFDATITDLQQRTATVPADQRPSVLLGGVAFKGPHGFNSTEPTYPPFQFVNAYNLAYDEAMTAKELSNTTIAKEQIVVWDPDILFLDLSTLQMGDEAGGLYELQNDPAYRTLTAVREDRVYGVLPYNWYTSNHGSILANAYYVGSVLYPERFADIDPRRTADDIYSFLVGRPVFDEMNRLFGDLAFAAIPLR
ncbi:iron ABC transporter substrate-binding protein [Desulfofustis glycolicus]|uniref:Iron complex transport system substrate-binding protein n=1 Tax=Desulfofustis glycolicus DSM 9705 TaxID=1121409 RepID=A0A1M5XZJ0_9BACT|nr:iron ABC transporter substrate-binding protein [Desulfofustis glycolicus]SHI04994.1 iron complex transport system substrate-binding protein [Desulfofustis glycolicus DSM 9705]